MKLLKELFAFDDEHDDDEFAPEENEFNFDFDFENPDADQELDFNDDGFAAGPGMDVEDEADYGAEEDYPEGMYDMPSDDYEADGEGGLDDLPDEQEELADIKGEIESLYARLGKLAAAGDLNLLDGEPDGDMEMEDDPDFSTFQDMDMGYEDEMMSPDYEEDGAGFDDVDSEFDQGPELGDPSGDVRPQNAGAPPLEDEMNSRFQSRHR